MRLYVFILLLLPTLLSAGEKPRIIHTFVALCDNESQGIVPVPKKIGNGNDPFNNLYWGALYGVKTHFRKHPNWKQLHSAKLSETILERVVFKHKSKEVYLIADAYSGNKIQTCIQDFINACAGKNKATYSFVKNSDTLSLPMGGNANLLSYIGHDGLMEFELKSYPMAVDSVQREAIILACISRDYFYEALHNTTAEPLVWTTGFMAPEAYTLSAAIEGWIRNESNQQIRNRAAGAYHKYQKCGLKGAKRLLVTGWE